jgi:hypothetical protein
MPLLEQSNGAAKVSWPSVVGRIYQLQYSDSLETPNWTNIGKGVHGSGGTEFVIVPVDTDAKKNRFYRVVDFE